VDGSHWSLLLLTSALLPPPDDSTKGQTDYKHFQFHQPLDVLKKSLLAKDAAVSLFLSSTQRHGGQRQTEAEQQPGSEHCEQPAGQDNCQY
jgi:hypothetical protein